MEQVKMSLRDQSLRKDGTSSSERANPVTVTFLLLVYDLMSTFNLLLCCGDDCTDK